MSIVSVSCCNSYNSDELYRQLQRSIELAGGFDIGSYSQIAIKINICDARTPDTGAVTHPAFLDILLRYLREKFGDIPIFVLESDGVVVLADEFIGWLGYSRIIERWNARFVNLSKSPSIDVVVNGSVFSSLSLPLVVRDSFFITCAKLKTNVLSQITCALKNQYGVMPMVDKNQYHPVLDRAIAELNTVYRPDFSIVDGIIGHGGTQGPAFGIPIPAGVIVAGKDPVAVDTCCSHIMKVPPVFVGHLRLSEKLGVGHRKHQTVGDQPPRVDFNVNLASMLLFKTGSAIKRKLTARRRASASSHVMPDKSQHVDLQATEASHL